MRRFPIAPLIVLSTCTLSSVFASRLLAAPVLAAQNEIVTEVITLNFMKPTNFLKCLEETGGSGFFTTQAGTATVETEKAKSLMPAGVSSSVPNNEAKTITLTGTKSAIEEVKHIARLLDVRPWQIGMKVRLVETRIDSSRRRTRSIIQTSTLMTTNNRPVQTAITTAEGGDIPEFSLLSLQLTPHVNGDNSLSLLANLQRTGNSDDRKSDEKVSIFQRFGKSDEWNTFRTLTFNPDKEIQSKVQAGGAVPESAYPLYSLEFLYAVTKE
jgi:hypothetical protein